MAPLRSPNLRPCSIARTYSWMISPARAAMMWAPRTSPSRLWTTLMKPRRSSSACAVNPLERPGRDPDLVTIAVARFLFGQTAAGHFRVGEDRPGHLHPQAVTCARQQGVADGQVRLPGGVVGELVRAYQVAAGVNVLLVGPQVLVDRDALCGVVHAGLLEAELLDVRP